MNFVQLSQKVLLMKRDRALPVDMEKKCFEKKSKQ